MAELDGGETGAGEPSATPTRFCHSCGTRLSEPIGRFCQNCGAEVALAAETTAAPGPATQSGSSAQEPATDSGRAPNNPSTSPDRAPSSPKPPNRKRSLSWLLALVPVAALAAAGTVLLGGGSGGSKKAAKETTITTLPSPGDMPPDTVALISHLPSARGTVTRTELDRAITQNVATSGIGSLPTPGSRKYREIEESALFQLLNSIWLQGQAEEMGIVATPKQIGAELVRLRTQNFKTTAAFDKYIRESHFTSEDVKNRVKDQILGTEIQKRITRGQESEEAKQRAEGTSSRYSTGAGERGPSARLATSPKSPKYARMGPLQPRRSEPVPRRSRSATKPTARSIRRPSRAVQGGSDMLGMRPNGGPP